MLRFSKLILAFALVVSVGCMMQFEQASALGLRELAPALKNGCREAAVGLLLGTGVALVACLPEQSIILSGVVGSFAGSFAGAFAGNVLQTGLRSHADDGPCYGKCGRKCCWRCNKRKL